MPINKQTSHFFEVANTQNDKISSFVFDTKEEFISHLIKTKEIKKDPSRYNDGLIHLIGTLKVDNRVKKGLNWNDVVVTAAIVDNEGKVETPTIQSKTISFGNNLVQDIAAAQNIMFEIQIEGYDDTSKIYIQSTDKIDIDLSLFAKAKIELAVGSNN